MSPRLGGIAEVACDSAESSINRYYDRGRDSYEYGSHNPAERDLETQRLVRVVAGLNVVERKSGANSCRCYANEQQDADCDLAANSEVQLVA
jgi:hypothetical protein